MIIKSKILADALKSLLPLTRENRQLPILSCVLMEAKINRLHITASNLNSRASCKLKCDGDLDAICVNANYLSFSVGAGEATTLKMEGKKLCINPSGVKLATLDASDFPALPEQKNAKSIGVHWGDLADAIDAVAWACSTDETREVLCNVHLVGSAKSILAEATDGRWMAWIEKPSIAADFEFLARDEFCKEITNALRQESADLKVCPESISVKHDAGFYWCKQAEGKYSSGTKQIREEKTKPIGEIETAPLIEVLRTGVGTFNKPASYPAADLCFSKNGLRITSASENDLDKTIEGDFKPLQIRLAMNLMLKCAESLKSEKAKLSFTENALAMQSGDLTVLLQKMLK